MKPRTQVIRQSLIKIKLRSPFSRRYSKKQFFDIYVKNNEIVFSFSFAEPSDVYFALRIGIGGTAIALEPCSVFVTHFSLLIPNTYHLSSHFTQYQIPVYHFQI